MNVRSLVLLIAVVVTMVACNDSSTTMNRGFSLPRGDIENGEVVFSDLQCVACHVLAGSGTEDMQRAIAIPLDPKIKRYSYEFLLTSIINPSHRLAKGFPVDRVSYQGTSKMRNYNDFLTVTELVDLVEFLRAELDVPEPPKTVYPDLSIPIMRDPAL